MSHSSTGDLPMKRMRENDWCVSNHLVKIRRKTAPLERYIPYIRGMNFPIPPHFIPWFLTNVPQEIIFYRVGHLPAVEIPRPKIKDVATQTPTIEFTMSITSGFRKEG